MRSDINYQEWKKTINHFDGTGTKIEENIGFPKYIHSVCWWRLAISAGGPLIYMPVSV